MIDIYPNAKTLRLLEPAMSWDTKGVEDLFHLFFFLIRLLLHNLKLQFKMNLLFNTVKKKKKKKTGCMKTIDSKY